MQRQVLIAVLFCPLFFLARPAQAKPRLVDLRAELEDASAVVEVTILQYMDNRFWVQPVHGPAVRSEVRYSTDPLWNPKQLVQKSLESAKELTGLWPPVGSTVVLVLGQYGVVSLFAQAESDGYRFWSPQATGSIAMFACAPPAKIVQPVPGQGDYYRNKSWDGCLMPQDRVTWKDLSPAP